MTTTIVVTAGWPSEVLISDGETVVRQDRIAANGVSSYTIFADRKLTVRELTAEEIDQQAGVIESSSTRDAQTGARGGDGGGDGGGGPG
jgi:hypothetical protein